MSLLFRNFVLAAALLTVATLGTVSLIILELGTASLVVSTILFASMLMSALLAPAIVLTGVLLQVAHNRYEAAFRQTCTEMHREPGEPMSPAFLEVLGARLKQFAGTKRNTPREQKLRFSSDILICGLMGAALGWAAAHFFPESGTGLPRTASEVLYLLPGLLATTLYGTWKLHLVMQIQDLQLLQVMIELSLQNLSDDEATRRKDLWVSRRLRRTLLQIVYERQESAA